MPAAKHPKASSRGGSGRGRSAPSSRLKTVPRPPRRRSAVRPRPPRSAAPRRLVVVFFALMGGFALMASRLFVLQVVEAPAYARLAEEQRTKFAEFPARRGAILDRNGRALAISVDLQTVYADPSLVEDPRGTAGKLAEVLKMPASDIEALLTVPQSRFQYLKRQVQPDVARRIAKMDLAGVGMQTEAKRIYPDGSLAAQILGFVNIDGDAQEGIEVQYDDILHGKPGRMRLEQDPSGRPLPQAEFSYEAPAPGDSLLLTIDKDIQYSTEVALSEAVGRYQASSGSAIVMDPRTGEILALANVPTFDPNDFSDSDAQDRRNRALTDVYEPGSVFKVVTASAALAEDVVTPTTRFTVPDQLQVADRVIHDSHYHATESMSVRQIIEQSSNVGTVMIGQRVGGELLDRYVRRFGFGTRTGLDFPAESPGIVLPLEQWSGSSIANIPIGQGIAVTPMQMLTAYATVANGGVWVEPKLLHGTVDDEGDTTASPRAASKRVLPRRVASVMTDILSGVVAKGTGIEGQIPGYDVAGKTGTAQQPLPTGGYGDVYAASFAGYAPAKHPRLVAIVTLADPSPIWGGSTAAPTFKIIMQQALQKLGVPPTGNAERAAEEINSTSSDLSSQD